MSFNDNHRDEAAEIARHLAKKDSTQSTRISGLFVMLWNAVGPLNCINLIWHYSKQILAGNMANCAGRNMFNRGAIHPMKQKFVNALYKRLVRELVLPIIYAYFKAHVEPGAFVATLVIPEDVPRLHGHISYDESANVETDLSDFIKNINYAPGTAGQIMEALKQGIFGDFELKEQELLDSDGNFDSEHGPDFVANQGLAAGKGAGALDVLNEEDVEDQEEVPVAECEEVVDSEVVDSEQVDSDNESFLSDMVDQEEEVPTLKRASAKGQKRMRELLEEVDIDLVDDEVEVVKNPPKRGRGRPRGPNSKLNK